jgi:rRNA small subunit pseudouridine methyltransferase Nep1
MLHLIFLESSLELIPPEIFRHSAVISDARRRKKNPSGIILDDSRHHAAMRRLYKAEKRGRPDIIHTCLLLALDSPIKELSIHVHTFHGKIIWINRETRLPRNYNRFIGLMEDLFENRCISSGGKKLIEITDITLSDLLTSLNCQIVVMDEKGDPKLDESLKKDIVVCIGAYPHGNFEKETLHILKEFDAEFVSISREPLTSLYVTGKVLCEYERMFSPQI